MNFPWDKYDEIPAERKNTLQIFITDRCNLKCGGCFARNIMGSDAEISIQEYKKAIESLIGKGGKQINILGGEPLLHPDLKNIIKTNKENGLKTTIYTNGHFLNNFKKQDFEGAKLRVSLYCKSGSVKSFDNLPNTEIPFEVCYMISSKTTLNEMVESADSFEKRNGKVFFISSIRELDNPNKEFFEDTKLTMNLLEYKTLVHSFLEKYMGNMEIHISKRGMFESTKAIAGNKCKFANYFIGGKIIQCPYDVINKKFQKDYSFNERYCRQNSSCLMSKIIVKRK